MDRRSFLDAAKNAVSGSFLLGGVGGAAVAGAAVALYHRPGLERWSYAQQGEDLVVLPILRYLGFPKPTYLDVGAYDPVANNNTYLMYLVGGRGVLVEPNPALTSRLRSVRPRDTVLGVGIGLDAQPSTADYYVIGGSSRGLFNTFSKKDAELLDSQGVNRIEKVIKLPLENINTVIQRHLGAAPNFLSLDTEGLDLEILRSLDFDRYRPDVICVETLVMGSDRVNLEILRFLEARRYSARAATFVNTIFVDDRHLSQPGPLTAAPR